MFSDRFSCFLLFSEFNSAVFANGYSHLLPDEFTFYLRLRFIWLSLSGRISGLKITRIRCLVTNSPLLSDSGISSVVYKVSYFDNCVRCNNELFYANGYFFGKIKS